MLPSPRLCCLDLDTFFVSVERLLDPSLVGRPVVVGGRPGQRGVVTSASYEVRTLGVRSGMSMGEAQRLAPDAVFVPTRHGTYGEYARRVREVLERHCPVVQTASIDEFYLDFRGCEGLHRRPGDEDDDVGLCRAVREMREAVQREVSLPASAGIGATRAIAKMASGRAKPAGVLMVRAGEERAFVRDLPVRKFPGIGPVAEERLVAAGILTLGQLLDLPADAPPALLPFAERVREGVFGGSSALGRDRPAFREHDEAGVHDGSISNEHTFSADIGQIERARVELRALVERVAWRVRRREARARTVTVKLKYADFEVVSRSRSIAPTDAEATILAVADELMRAAWARRSRIRLLGVALSNLVGAERQLALPFPRPGEGRRDVATAVDAVRARFGYDAVRLGAAGRGRAWSA